MLLQSFIMAGAVNGLFFSGLLKFGSKRILGYQQLALWMSVVALQLLFYFDGLSIRPLLATPLQIIGFSLPILSSPILYFYIFTLTTGKQPKLKTAAYHFLPFIIFLSVAYYLNSSNDNNLTFDYGVPVFGAGADHWAVYLLLSLLAVVPGYYSFATLSLLRQYRQMLPTQFSYTEKISLNWLRWMTVSVLVLFITLFLLIKFGMRLGLVNYQSLFAVVGTVLSAYVFFVAFCGISQQPIALLTTMPSSPATPTEELSAEANRYKNSGLNFQQAELLFSELSRHMHEQQPYLKDDLSLAILAKQLNITPNQLSQVINQQAKANFFNFVNGYRVEAVKMRLADPSLIHLSILGLAYECGFRSKSAFNKIFKDFTDQTPLQYRKGKLGK